MRHVCLYIDMVIHTDSSGKENRYDYRRLGLLRISPPSHTLSALTTANYVVLRRMHDPFFVPMHNGFASDGAYWTMFLKCVLLVRRPLWRDQRRSKFIQSHTACW